MDPTPPERRLQKHFVGDSRTKQSFRDECDINVMMRKWNNNGVMPTPSTVEPQYGDFSNVQDYMEAFDTIQDARDQFMELPSAVRRACDNDPGTFIQMVHDPERKVELTALGLLEEKVPEKAKEPEPTTPQGGE